MSNNNKLKVLAIIPSGFCFGLQHVSVDLFAAARESLDTHFVVTGWSNGDFEKLLQKHNFSYSYSWLGMFSRKFDWYNLKMSLHALSKLPKLYYDFIKLCRQKDPEIIFFANHHELLLLLPALKFTSRKVVCHMHDPAPAIPFQKKTFKWYGNRVDHFIAISEDVKKRLMDLGCANEKITVIHNGIDIQKHLVVDQKIDFNSKFQWPQNSFIIGITGQMTITKGHEDLLDAFELALQKNPLLRLVIGGKKLEPLYSILTKKIEERELQHNVAFSGWLEKVEEFYNSIDLFVLASRHDEGYGLVVAEAMASGKPVITTRSGGATEIVEDGVNGFVVDKSNPNAMAEKLSFLSSQPSLYARFSEAARKRIVNDFNMRVTEGKFSKLLHTLAR